MLQKRKRAVLIGETKLCIQCAEYLVSGKWEIVFIVSEDIDVINWARDQSIPVMLMSQVNSAIKDGIYLFSIINPQIIPTSILDNPNVLLAINYHDSPLPKYAGVNSTTWAILNNEKSHGVTLHRITAGIDDGDIVAQSIIDIEKDETAISLNLKCSERLLSLFQDVITKIETNALSISKQDLADRSYYGLKYLPVNYSIINGIKDVKKLSQLVRGLNFGNGYDNPVASVKIWLNGQFYIGEGFVASDQEMLFDKVKDIYGNETNLKIKHHDILTEHQLTEDELRYLSNVKVQERKCKKQILEFFRVYPDASTAILDQATNKSKKYTKEISLSNKISDATIFAVVYLVLVRFFYRNDFIISLYNSDNDNSTSVGLQDLVENRGFIYANTETLNHGFNHLVNYLIQAQKKCCTIVKDFGYRYGLQLLTDVAIALGEVASTDQHKIIIKIRGNGRLIIEGDIAYQPQIDSIAESIKTVLDEDEISTKDLKHINLLNQAQYQQIVYDWNKTEKDYPKNKTVHQLFEEQVVKTPNNIAVVYENTKLTYQELNNKANQLAHYLIQNYNIQPDDLVALCLDRNEQMIIAMLGVLKAGGAYVPIDPSYPNERIEYILDDTKTRVVLANDIYTNRLQQLIKQKIDVIAIDSKETQIKLTKQKNINPITSTVSNNLMYVIYTSGTTGNPKGVLIGHHSVANYITYLISYNDLDGKSIGSQYAGFGFDASVCEIYPILLSGGALYIVPEQDKSDPIKINDFFCKNSITRAFLPTKFAELFFNLKNTSLINLIVAGEKLEKFIEQSYKVSNGYGPTESTVHTTNFLVDRQYKNIPIGKPINNVKCYVVDNKINILPIGAIGELMIGGECLARGYLNRPDLTAEKFISNPFQTQEEKEQNKNSKLYKTGDLVRMLLDGNLEYIGRNDLQVKIRGYRIELGEIESKLLSYPDIKQAVVLVKERILEHIIDKYLLAYYVADKKLDDAKINDYLAIQLPDYMLPRALICLNKFPLTTNGKLNREALPVPKFEDSGKYEAPTSEKERLICVAFTKVLGIEKIGVDDDFFTMGGHSIQAIHLTAILQDNFDIKVADIFNLRTPKKLAKSSSFGRDILRQKLEQIKLSYQKKLDKNPMIDKKIQKEMALYLKDSYDSCVDCSLQKPITNVLLTGATGYLGCNILNQLLNLTNYNIFLLVRANSQRAAVDRVNKKFKFYFDKALDEVYGCRVFIIRADIEKSDLGLSSKEYQKLVTKVDSIIHAAALVKHYGEYDKFYSANVKATINLLELVKLTKTKDFHYISTCSVLNFGCVSNREKYLYTEYDLPDSLEKHNNVYVQTKLQGEQEVAKYRDYGINSNIYRVGNLVFMAENYRAQENIEDNAFFNWLMYLFQIKCTAKDINMVEISYADLTAQAIVKLFDKKQLDNDIYHVFNPYLFNMSSVFADGITSSVATLTMEQFIDNITRSLDDNMHRDLVMRFLLHQGWLDNYELKGATLVSVLQDRTKNILKQLGFEWTPVSDNAFSKYLELLKLQG